MVAEVVLPLLGTRVHPMTAVEVADLVLERTRDRRGAVVGNVNLHGSHLYLDDGPFRQYTESADVVLVDGFPVWLLARLRDPQLSRATRIGSTDWLFELLDREVPVRIVSVGGTAESAANAQKVVAQRYPWVEWVAFDGFAVHDDPTDPALREALESAQLVLVGMGMPRQESWILAHRDQLASKVVANVGGCIDYISGEQKLAPRWMGRYGVEWVYRLAASPTRLAHRYLVEPWTLAYRLMTRRVVGSARPVQ